MEWRVKSVSVRGCFAAFGDNEKAARYFATERLVEKEIRDGKTTKKISVMQYGGILSADPIGPYQLQCRPSGTVGNDSTWKDISCNA
jgi:hypothetical protein